MGLPFHAPLHKSLALADLDAVDFAPGVFGNADLVAPHCIGNLRDRERLAAGELRDGIEVEQEQTFGFLGEGVRRGQCVILGGFAASGQAPEQRRDQTAARYVIGLGNRNVPYARVADKEPIWKVPFLFDDP